MTGTHDGCTGGRITVVVRRDDTIAWTAGETGETAMYDELVNNGSSSDSYHDCLIVCPADVVCDPSNWTCLSVWTSRLSGVGSTYPTVEHDQRPSRLVKRERLFRPTSRVGDKPVGTVSTSIPLAALYAHGTIHVLLERPIDRRTLTTVITANYHRSLSSYITQRTGSTQVNAVYYTLSIEKQTISHSYDQ